MQDNFHRPDDHEAKMARADLFKCAQYSFKLFKMIQEDQELEGWVQAKITKAADYIASVYHYLEYEMKISEYGSAIENSDMYSESIRRSFAQKLTEAKKAKDEMKKKEKALDEEKSSTGGEIDRSKKGVTKHKENPNRFSDEEHTEPKSQAKSKSAAEKAGDKAYDKAHEKDSKAWGKANPGKQTIMKGGVKTTNETAVPMNPDGATAPPKKNPKTGRYPVITSGPNKGKEWSAAAPGPTNPALATMKEAAKSKKGDGNLANNAKPYDKVTQGDVIAGRLGKDEKGGKDKNVKEAAAKCNHTDKGEKCPVHGLKECGMYEDATKTMSRAAKGHEKYGKEGMAALAKAGKEGKDLDKVRDKYNKYDESSKFDPLKHVEKKSQTPPVKQAAKDVDRKNYGDRTALMKAGGVKDTRGPRGVTQG